MGQGAQRLHGVMGRAVEVDLTSGRVEPFEIPEQDWVELLGGKGLATKLLLRLLPGGTDPLSPDNVMVFSTGLLTGSGAPCSSRFNLTSKSPLTGGISSSNCGGTFGMHLRWAGYDVLVVRGRAEHPVMLQIDDDGVRVKDARHLWGLDTVETQATLPEHVGSLVIGPAGEHLVRYACVMSGHRTLGRTGTGAVMGSKLLKAITASGTSRLPVAKPRHFQAAVKSWAKTLRSHPITGEQLPRYGTAGLAATANATHTLPVRNFSSGHTPELGTASGEGMADTILERNSQCRSCPIRCARVVKIDDRVVKGPEFETLGMFGPNQGTFDIEAITKLGLECDRLGMDTISAGSTLAFAMELGERGMLDTELRFGDPEGTMAALRSIAYREGLGEDLAEGTLRMARKHGGKDFAMHSKGLEFASYEPRNSVGLGLGYAVAARGGCHLEAGYLVFFEALGPLQVDPLTPVGKAALTVFQQNAFDAVSSAGNCIFTTYAVLPGGLEKFVSLHGRIAGLASKVILGSHWMLDLQCRLPPWALPMHLPLIPQSKTLSALTGRRIALGEFLAAGERAGALARMFNLREGFGRKDDSLPARLTHEPERAANPNTVVPLERLLRDYYKVRDWDEAGVPTARALRRLGLDWLEPLAGAIRTGAHEAALQRPAREAQEQEAANARVLAALELGRSLAAQREELSAARRLADRTERALEVRGATFAIHTPRCVGCGLCAKACPAEAIEWSAGSPARILPDRCVRCGLCEQACPPRFRAALRTPRPSDQPPPQIHRVNPETCGKCGLCYKACPVDAITWKRRGKAVIDEAVCVRCGRCFSACPPKWAAVLRIEEEAPCLPA